MKTKRKTAWKYLVLKAAGITSNHDGSPWRIGKWRKVPAPTQECRGLNASLMVQDALYYVKGDVLALVEYGGKVIESGDKLTCERMRIVKAWRWTKIASVRMACYAARLTLGLYESKYPGDNRPRAAIEAAEKWAANPSDDAARAASYAASDAASAASAASDAASDAASAASAASYAARAASYAASHAASAASYAARAASYAASHAASAASAASYAARAASAASYAASAQTRQAVHDYVTTELVKELEVISE